MIRSIFPPKAFRLRHWLAAGLLLACAGVVGCNSFGARENQLQYDPGLNVDLSQRPPIEENDFFGVSNESRQIERNLVR